MLEVCASIALCWLSIAWEHSKPGPSPMVWNPMHRPSWGFVMRNAHGPLADGISRLKLARQKMHHPTIRLIAQEKAIEKVYNLLKV
jgi:hypothetical protein